MAGRIRKRVGLRRRLHKRYPAGLCTLWAIFSENGIIGSDHVLPTDWRDLAGRPDNPVTDHGKLDPTFPIGYGYNWWTFPVGRPPFPTGAFTAQGIFGQFVFIDPTENIVAAIWSAWPEAWVRSSELETYALLRQAIATLR